jgi:FAD/FMN-containing dehydrogenase
MISELYVPREALPAFLAASALIIRGSGAEVLYGTVRLIERDDHTLLAWAREPWACTIFNILVEHTGEGRERAQHAFRGLIDAALAHGGSYYLTYHRWATTEQLLAAHPRIGDFVAAKRRWDPEGVFCSDWYAQIEEQVRTRDAVVG